MAKDSRVILVAVDASEYSEYAFDWYVKYMHHAVNRMLCIHIPDHVDVDKLQKEIAKGGQMKESLERQYSLITELEERYQHKMHAQKIAGTVLSVPTKNAGQAILDTAREEGAFAIVMGTRGRSKLKKAIMGSVSDYVMANAEMPVIIVRKKESA